MENFSNLSAKKVCQMGKFLVFLLAVSYLIYIFAFGKR